MAHQLSSVDVIYSNRFSFAALKLDGSVVTWGMSIFGGDSSAVASQLTSVDVIYSTIAAFAAKKADGVWQRLQRHCEQLDVS